MNNKWRCTESEWLKLHEKYTEASEDERWNVLTREETYLYYNLRNVPEEYQIDKRKYKIIK